MADRHGEESFSVEPSGRYGALGAAHAESIRVHVCHIDDVLGEVLEAEQQIDVLKIDTEGTEARILRAASSELLDRVAVIYVEDTERAVESFPASMRLGAPLCSGSSTGAPQVRPLVALGDPVPGEVPQPRSPGLPRRVAVWIEGRRQRSW